MATRDRPHGPGHPAVPGTLPVILADVDTRHGWLGRIVDTVGLAAAVGGALTWRQDHPTLPLRGAPVGQHGPTVTPATLPTAGARARWLLLGHHDGAVELAHLRTRRDGTRTVAPVTLYDAHGTERERP